MDNNSKNSHHQQQHHHQQQQHQQHVNDNNNHASSTFGNTGQESSGVNHTAVLDLEVSKLTEALYQEKEKAEDRSQRVLEILQAKDDEINKLAQENEDLQLQLNETQRNMMKQTTESRLKMDQLNSELEQCQREKQEVEYEMETLRASLQELHGGRASKSDDIDNIYNGDFNNQTSSGGNVPQLNAKIKDQDEQIEVLIAEVAKLRAENDANPTSQNTLLSSINLPFQNKNNPTHVIRGLQNALEEQREKVASLARDLEATKWLKDKTKEKDVQLDRFKEITRDLKRTNADQKCMLEEKNKLLNELKTVKSTYEKETEERKNSDDIILKLRRRVRDLESLQETATKTVIDGEHRLSMAVEQVEELKRVQATSKNVEDPLSISTLHLAQKTITDLKARLKLAEGNERVLRRKMSEIMEEEIRMAELEQKQTGGKNPLQYRHTVRSLIMRLDKFRNKKEDERKGDLHAIEHLQKEVEEKVVEVVDVRQAMVRQAAEARKRLRVAEESLIERNTLVLECKKKLRLQKNDKDTEIRELERAIRILRGNSNLHNQIAALTTEITTLKKDRERREMEKKSHLNQIKRLAEQCHISRIQVDEAETELARLKLGIAGTNIRNITPEQIVISLCLKRGEDREEIERLKSLIDGVDSYRRILPNNHVKSDSEDISRNNKNKNSTRETKVSFINDVYSHEKDVENLKGKPLTTEGQIAVLELQAKRLSNNVEILSSELSEREKAYHEAQCEIIDLKEKQGQEAIRRDEIHSNQISTLSRRMATYVAENELIRSDLRKAEREVREARSKLMSAAAANSSNTSSSTSESDKKHGLLALTKGAKSDSALLFDAKKEIQRLKVILKDRNTQLSVLMETVDVLQAGVEDDGHDSTAHHSIQQDRIIELTAQVSEKSTVISRLSQQNEELNSELIQLQKTEKNNSSKNNNMIATISSLERSLAKERSEVDSLQKELDSAVKRTQMQTLDLKEQKSKIVDLKLERDSWESQLRRARERYLQRLRDHLAETGADAENGRETKSNKNSSNRGGNDEFSGLLEEWKQLTSALRELTISPATNNKERENLGDAPWVIERLKRIILDNDETLKEAIRHGRNARWEADCNRRKIILLESSLERHLSQNKSSAFEQMQLLRQQYRSKDAVLRSHIETITGIYTRRIDDLREHLQDANARVMELEVMARHAQLDCQFTESRLQESLAQQRLAEVPTVDSQVLQHLHEIKSAAQVVQDLVDDAKQDQKSMLLRFAEGMVSDARAEEAHANEEQLMRLQRALDDSKVEIQSLTEWKTAAMEREERLRREFQEGTHDQLLKAEGRFEKERSKLGRRLNDEATKLNENLAKQQMKYEKMIEELRIQLREQKQTRPGVHELRTVRQERETVDEENMKLMTKVKILSSELKTLQSQQKGKDTAVDDLRDFVAQLANKAGVTGNSTTRGGENVNTAEELAKELVNSKIQISELKRKLRVASRVESELRSTVATREARIKELKTGSNLMVAAGRSQRQQQQKQKTISIRQLEDELTSERARVALLSKEIANLRERKDEDGEDVNIKSLYEKIEEMAEREKQLGKEIMRLTTQIETSNMPKTIKPNKNNDDKDGVKVPATAHLVTRNIPDSTAENEELKARLETLEKASGKRKNKFNGDGVLAQRLSYLEGALEISEKQRRALETRLTSLKKRSMKKSATPSSSTNEIDYEQKVDDLVQQNNKQQEKYDTLSNDYALLRKKFDSMSKEKEKLMVKMEKKSSKTGKRSSKRGKSSSKPDSTPSPTSDESEQIKKEKKELEAQLTSITNDYRVLRRKFDNINRENESKADLLNSKDNNAKDLLKRLQIAENALEIDRRRLDKEKRDIEDKVKEKLQELEKRQVQVEAELNHDRTSLTQTAVKIEADLRADLGAANNKKQQLEAECLELKSQLMTMTRANTELLQRIRDRESQYTKELSKLRSENTVLQSKSIEAERSFHDDMQASNAHAVEVEENAAEMKRQLVEMTETNAELVSRMRDFEQQQAGEHVEMTTEFMKQLTKMQDQLEQAHSHSHEVEAKAEASKTKALNNSRAALEGIKAKSESMNVLLQKLEHEKEYLANRINSLESERETSREKIHQMENDYAEAKEKISELQKEKEMRTQTLAAKIADSMTEEENTKLHELELLRKQEITAKQDEIDTLTTRLKKAEADLKHNANSADFEISNLKTRCESLKNQLESVQKSLEEAHATSNNRMSEREAKFNEIEHDLRKTIIELKDEANKATSHATHIEHALEKAHETEKHMSNDIKSYKKKLTKIEHQLQTFKEKSDKEHEEALSSIQQELQTTKKALAKEVQKRTKVEEILDEERKDLASKIKLLYEEGQRRQEANDNLSQMFELQIVEMKKTMIKEKKAGEDEVNLTVKLAERTAAVEILRAELNELKAKRRPSNSSVSSSGSDKRGKKKRVGRFDNHKKVRDMTDLSVLELRCSRIEVEKKNAETEVRLLKDQITDLKATQNSLTDMLEKKKEAEGKAKLRIRSVAKVANKKHKALKTEVSRLRDQIDVLRKNWMPPGDVEEKEKLVKTLRDAVKSLKIEMKKKDTILQKYEEEDKTENKKWENVEAARKKAVAKAKRALSEASRKASVEKRLRERLEQEKKEADNAKEKLEELEKKLRISQRNLNQRRIAMESMREGVHAQRDRLAEIQGKIKNQKELEKTAKEMKVSYERKSSEARRSLRRLGEAERTYKEALDKISALKKTLSEKDAKVRKETESSERRVSAVENRFKSFIEETASSIIDVAKEMIDGNNKLRARVNALKSAIVTPTKSPRSAQALSSVASMLDMSMNEVNDLLGLRTRDPISNQEQQHGGSPIRAMHDQALRYIKGAFTMDKVDSIRVQETLMQIINEKIRLEKQLIDVQKSLQNRKKASLAVTAATRTANDAVARKIDLSSVGNNNNTSRTSMRVGSENFGKDEVITNVHISRQGSIDITTQELPSIADDIDLTNESLNLKQDEEQEATSAVTSALRPQKRAALKRRLKQLQEEAGIESTFESPVSKKGGAKSIRIERGESFNASLLSPSPFKK